MRKADLFENNVLRVALDKIQYIKEYRVDINNYYYKIDFYIPDLNLAIEFDEEAHKNQRFEDWKRQIEIEEKLSCTFFRVSEFENKKQCLKRLAILIKLLKGATIVDNIKELVIEREVIKKVYKDVERVIEIPVDKKVFIEVEREVIIEVPVDREVILQVPRKAYDVNGNELRPASWRGLDHNKTFCFSSSSSR